MRRWRESRRLAVSVMVVIILLQIAIPTSLVGEEDQPRFGWQMFSAGSPLPAFEVVKAGKAEPVALDDYMARTRDEIDVTTLLPPHLCRVIAGAESITWDGGGEWSCSGG